MDSKTLNLAVDVIYPYPRFDRIENSMTIGDNGEGDAKVISVADFVASYCDPQEMIAEATARDALDDVGQARCSAILEAAVYGDDAEAGRILRELIFEQAEAWQRGDR